MNLLSEPIDPININFIENCDITHNISINYDVLLKRNLENLRLQHCNNEEKEVIRKLCHDYRSIFYCENIP